MRKLDSIPPAVAAQAQDLETVVTDEGRVLVIEHGITGRHYRLGQQHAYSTDAGSLIDGVLVWDVATTDVYLPAGGRRRERINQTVPRRVARELGGEGPRRVFFQRLGGLWAVEDPGVSVVVFDERGHPVEVAPLVKSSLGEPIPERPWALLTIELHVGRVALWAQIEAKLADTAPARALAERVRVAAFAAADQPYATFDVVRGHAALSGVALGHWETRMSRVSPAHARPLRIRRAPWPEG